MTQMASYVRAFTVAYKPMHGFTLPADPVGHNGMMLRAGHQTNRETGLQKNNAKPRNQYSSRKMAENSSGYFLKFIIRKYL